MYHVWQVTPPPECACNLFPVYLYCAKAPPIWIWRIVAMSQCWWCHIKEGIQRPQLPHSGLSHVRLWMESCHPEDAFYKSIHITFTFTFRAFSRRFYPKRLTISTFVKEVHQYIAVGTERMFIEPSASTTIARLTNSPCYSNDSSYCSCYTVKYYNTIQHNTIQCCYTTLLHS